MAHGGSLWKLNFRRDFNLNVLTYQHGIPDVYLLRFAANWGDPLPDPLAGASFLCPSDAMPNERTLQWTSAIVRSAGYRFTATLTLAISGVPATGDHRVTIREITLGIIWTLRNLVTDPHYTGFQYFNPLDTLSWSPSYFRSQPLGAGGTVNPVTYSGKPWPN